MREKLKNNDLFREKVKNTFYALVALQVIVLDPFYCKKLIKIEN